MMSPWRHLKARPRFGARWVAFAALLASCAASAAAPRFKLLVTDTEAARLIAARASAGAKLPGWERRLPRAPDRKSASVCARD